ncbi:hypothetical protein LTR10_008269 [Elasticomyces elasticus]|uniref:Protein kinase domain-containing protein n=1 Tax=Elasticomyces elasticus TaxID=574655 RepID=A0AAN7W0F5_9PEZI|nr:hypothetical protein LTR10_008269 [Elasticomyces elasticus]KAK4967145.1 hypothetical protein LTR42_010493 [Elasticomyces elasticus]KAK5694824.1 hypothetical protein LTR97_009415 [Elasticomyces elasticus]KAK5728570.1 hypothetical protein LTR15_001707 [Elasticomyces elasticus]
MDEYLGQMSIDFDFGHVLQPYYNRTSLEEFDRASHLGVEHQAMVIFDIATAMKDLHAAGIVHGHIRIENVGITTMTGRASLLSLELSRRVPLGGF